MALWSSCMSPHGSVSCSIPWGAPLGADPRGGSCGCRHSSPGPGRGGGCPLHTNGLWAWISVGSQLWDQIGDALCTLTLPRQWGTMAQRVLALVLCLSLAATASADCATQCSLCANQARGTESSMQPLVSVGPKQPPSFSIGVQQQGQLGGVTGWWRTVCGLWSLAPSSPGKARSLAPCELGSMDPGDGMAMGGVVVPEHWVMPVVPRPLSCRCACGSARAPLRLAPSGRAAGRRWHSWPRWWPWPRGQKGQNHPQQRRRMRQSRSRIPAPRSCHWHQPNATEAS